MLEKIMNFLKSRKIDFIRMEVFVYEKITKIRKEWIFSYTKTSIVSTVKLPL